MMNQFNGIILVDGESLSFDFSLIHTIKGCKFFIAVFKNKASFLFDMQKDGYGKWQILEPYPKWVKPYTEQLSCIIDQNI